jgi:hypothetical protein
MRMIGFPGQLVAPGETFSVTMTPALQQRAANKEQNWTNDEPKDESNYTHVVL